MKAWFRALAAFTLALSLLLPSWSTRARAGLQSSQSLSTTQASQALKDLQAHRKNPSKEVKSCFRRIPPSTSNPTQNMFSPPEG